jgi:thiol-disulfide isomerase/thioredoxin
MAEYLGYAAAWGPIALAALAVGSLIVLVLLRRPPPTASAAPRCAALCRSALLASVIGLIVAYGPMGPLFTTAGKLRAKVGEKAPDMAFTLVSDASDRHLRDFEGHVVVVNLWATWCPPCRRELPVLNHLQRTFRDRGLLVITLTDEARKDVLPVLQGSAPDVINGRLAAFGWLDIRAFRPFSLIIDADGVLRDFFFGAQEYEVFERKVLPYLDRR